MNTIASGLIVLIASILSSSIFLYAVRAERQKFILIFLVNFLLITGLILWMFAKFVN